MRKCLAIRGCRRDHGRNAQAHRSRLSFPAHEADGSQPAPRFMALMRATMAGATAFVTVNIWTGCPLLALWVGSQVVGERTLSMGAVGLVVVVLAVLVFVFAVALTWLNNVYDELTGRPRTE